MSRCVRGTNKVMFCLRPPSLPPCARLTPGRAKLLLIKTGGIFLIDFWVPVDKEPLAGCRAGPEGSERPQLGAGQGVPCWEQSSGRLLPWEDREFGTVGDCGHTVFVPDGSPGRVFLGEEKGLGRTSWCPSSLGRYLQ